MHMECGRQEGRRPLGRPIRSWEDIIKMDLRKVGYDCNLAHDRDRWRAYVRAEMNLQFLKRLLNMLYHMMKNEWNRGKFSPAMGFEPGFSALRADALSTKPHRIPIPMSD
ncbi:hypothetical protein ANN_19013 [Periplaneta americana]|uniref:Uncharacterized protein n=1 Tax=Periplaneta americana TaxID=6978 RepID=A0ABQ8SRN2_PERAM|nr:hypothetical protein ANN_19013 [Periplaneta americana]